MNSRAIRGPTVSSGRRGGISGDLTDASIEVAARSRRAPPARPKPADLTPTGIVHDTFEGFDRALREGVRPEGTRIDPFMPVHATELMTDVGIVAVWKYLRTLEPKAFGAR